MDALNSSYDKYRYTLHMYSTTKKRRPWRVQDEPLHNKGLFLLVLSLLLHCTAPHSTLALEACSYATREWEYVRSYTGSVAQCAVPV